MISEVRFYGFKPDGSAAWRSRVTQAGYGHIERSVCGQFGSVGTQACCSSPIEDIIHEPSAA